MGGKFLQLFTFKTVHPPFYAKMRNEIFFWENLWQVADQHQHQHQQHLNWLQEIRVSGR